MKGLNALLSVLALVAAIEAFYQHPTRGRGLRALLAAIQAGEAI